MNLILTMAGRYMRFISEGYKIPKYLLPWGNKPILSEIIHELTKTGHFSNVYLITNKRDEMFLPHVRSVLKAYGIAVENIFSIEDTSGQAETAYRGLQEIQKMGDITGSIVYHNIDTILYGRDYKAIKEALTKNDGYLDVFRSNNHGYSYVMVNDQGIAETIAEKIVISDMATSGLYGFSSADKFLEHYSESELYISNLYKKMIDCGARIAVGKLFTEKDTVVLGTPTSYLTSGYLLDLA